MSLATGKQSTQTDEAAALLSINKMQQARDLLYSRILQVPDDYTARKLLREIFLTHDSPPHEPPSDFFCPCCGNSFSMFLPGGPSFRPNACCPACESLERHRFLSLLLPQLSVWVANAQVLLHIAAEPCLQGQFRFVFGHRYFVMDLSAPADFKGDLCSLPIVSQSIDVVVANHVLEHVADDVASMREIFRVLKPNGKALLQVPINRHLPATQEAPVGATKQDLLKMFGQDDHVRMYGVDFKDRLEEAGLAVRRHVCRDVASPEELQSYGLIPETICWEATRP